MEGVVLREAKNYFTTARVTIAIVTLAVVFY